MPPNIDHGLIQEIADLILKEAHQNLALKQTELELLRMKAHEVSLPSEGLLRLAFDHDIAEPESAEALYKRGLDNMRRSQQAMRQTYMQVHRAEEQIVKAEEDAFQAKKNQDRDSRIDLDRLGLTLQRSAMDGDPSAQRRYLEVISEKLISCYQSHRHMRKVANRWYRTVV